MPDAVTPYGIFDAAMMLDFDYAAARCRRCFDYLMLLFHFQRCRFLITLLMMLRLFDTLPRAITLICHDCRR